MILLGYFPFTPDEVDNIKIIIILFTMLWIGIAIGRWSK